MSNSEKKHGLLAILAHPDDESFGMGGALAYYAAQGMPVSLICATRGEAGEISDPNLAAPETLGETREEELRQAVTILGLQEVILLDYRDSGMAGSEANDHPRAYVNAPAAKVVPRLVEIIRRIQPRVIITFEPNGGYGHPDHITVHHHTVAAFTAAANLAYRPDLGPQWQTDRLFYFTLTRAFFDEMRQRLVEYGHDVSQLEALLAEREGQLWPASAAHVVLDVGGVIDTKLAAMYCHRTQIGEDNFFFKLPEPAMRQQWSSEYYTLAWPQLPDGRRLPDLFAGLTDR